MVIFPPEGLVTNGGRGQFRNSESRAYPVRYGYDAQGQMSTMTTWTGFARLAGPEVTTWNYDLSGTVKGHHQRGEPIV